MTTYPRPPLPKDSLRRVGDRLPPTIARHRPGIGANGSPTERLGAAGGVCPVENDSQSPFADGGDSHMQAATFEEAMQYRTQAYESAPCTCEGDPQAIESCPAHGIEYSGIALWRADAESALENAQHEHAGKAPLNAGAYAPDAPPAAEKDISIREAMRPGYTFSHGGGSKSKKHADAKDLKARAPVGRPWIEDEPRTEFVGGRISRTTRAAIGDKSVAQVMFDVARAVMSGRTYEDVVGLPAPEKREAC